jgi:murein DD-endopeptidase MepM/ murein hydrolase activator NlpD
VARQDGSGLPTSKRGVWRDRQLLIRDCDGIRLVSLSSQRQQWLSVAGGVVVGALLTTVGVGVWQDHVIDKQAARVSELQDTHSHITARLDAILAEAQSHGARLPAAAPEGVAQRTATTADDFAALRDIVHRLTERREVLNLRVAQAADQSARKRAELERLRRRKAALQAELTKTRDHLRAVTSGRENLGDRLASTLAELHRARTRYQAEARRHDESQAKIEDLNKQLDTLRDRKAALKRKVADLSQRVSTTTSKRDELLAERKKLANRVGRLERTLGHVATAETTDLIERIGNLETSLVEAENKTNTYRERTKTLERKVASLKRRLTDVQKTQSGLFDHYTSQAETSLKAIEETVAMTGLDVDRMIQKARSDAAARGGPFVPASDMAEVVAKPARELDRKMQRLRLLQKVLSQLPLAPPLDSYWVSSHFGKRRDPYNGRWAMHEGVDLAGQPGLTVQAAAPGTVVAAGWKGGYGRIVEIEHGFGITTRYGHLKSVAVGEGEDVDHRAKLGKVGNTGRSTGPHVHYEVRVDGEPVDPMNFLKAGKHAFKG